MHAGAHQQGIDGAGRGDRPHPVIVTYGAPIDAAAYGIRRKGELIAEVRRQVAELAEEGLAPGPVRSAVGILSASRSEPTAPSRLRLTVVRGQVPVDGPDVDAPHRIQQALAVEFLLDGQVGEPGALFHPLRKLDQPAEEPFDLEKGVCV